MPVVTSNNKGQTKKKGVSGAQSTSSMATTTSTSKASLKGATSSRDEEIAKKGAAAAASSGSSTNSSSSSGSSSSGSSSGNDSSSSDSEDGSSSSSSGSDSTSSSTSNTNNNNSKSNVVGSKEKPNEDNNPIGVRTRSLSRSSRSRASSAASSVSSASSSAASSRKGGGSPSPKKSSGNSTVSSTTVKKTKQQQSHPPPNSNGSPGGSSIDNKKIQKPSQSTVNKQGGGGGRVANKPAAMSNSTKNELAKKSSGSQPINSSVSKKKGKKSDDNKSGGGSGSKDNLNSVASTSTVTPSTSSTTKSKVIKSGTVTNMRTIKPLSSTLPRVKKTKASSSTATSSSTTTNAATPSSSTINKLSKLTTVSSTKNLASKKFPDKHLPTKTSKRPPPVVPEKSAVKKPNSGAAGPTSSKLNKSNKSSLVVVSTTTTSPPSDTIASRTRHQSSCSSLSSTASSSASNSSAEDEEEPTPVTTPAKDVSKKVLKRKKGTVAPADKGKPTAVVTKKKTLKKKASEFLSKAEVLSSAEDESEAKSEAEEFSKDKKKKPAQQRRPVTRRQKLGTKKTIPTTTVFNQSLLLAAANSTSSPSATPTKKSSLAISSSSPGATGSTAGTIYPGEMTPLTKSSIINLLSTSNSSANSSESEGFSFGIMKNFPVSSTLTTQSSSNKNKYISTWDSDFSDDNFNSQLSQSTANFIRVPAKTSNKPPRNLDLSLLDPDTYEPPRCPFPSCDSSGHLSGRYPSHNFLSCCPRYHGFDNDECTENDQERSRRESERSRYRNILSTPGKKLPKQTSETKQWVNSIKELKEKDTENGLVSEYDNLLWKDALAIAADKIEKEQSEGINNQVLIGAYYRLSMAVAMGRFEMKCWCASPYPEPLSQNRRLFVCEFCLKPVGSGTILRRHCAKCVWRHPPGDEIYRKDKLSVWEVDGKKQKTYCQNLCLLAKCFLDHKTLYLDVDPFLFYVMTLADSQGCHLVGYFSKEKNSFLNYNVSCILTLPPYQRQGFGRLLIDFSYLLTRVEGKVGSPEKPLSDLGLISYRSYWKDAVLRRLCACASREINIKDLSIELGVSTADLISTLQYLGMLKYWKGKHLVLKKQDVLEEYLDRVRRRGEQRQIDSSCLRWRPYQPPPDENSSSEKS